VIGWIAPHRIGALLPGSVSLALAALLLVALGVVAFAIQRVFRASPRPDENRQGLWALIVLGFLVAYLAVILLTVLFLDRLTPLNERILGPVYLLAVPLLCTGLGLVWHRLRGGPFRSLLVVAAGVAVIVLLYRGGQTVGSMRRDGLGLSSAAWKSSPTLAYVRTLDSRPLYTNNLPALYFLAGRNSSFVPVSWNPAASRPREDFAASLEAMRNDLRCNSGRLIIVGENPAERISTQDRGEILAGLVVEAEFSDGLVYAAPPGSCDDAD
jgi:hypothetical protein